MMVVMDEHEHEQEQEEDEEEQAGVENDDKSKASSSLPNDSNSNLPKSLPPFLGRHRMAAAITQLNIQIAIIQEELKELETVGESSIVCRDVISNVGTVPDPLLPVSNGAIDVNWDRWFRGAHSSKPNKRWI